MRVMTSNGKWIKVSFTKKQARKVVEKAYEKEILSGQVEKIDIEHPVRNVVADREISFAHPEYWQSNIYYTYAHKIDMVVFFHDMRRIEIWETDPIPVTETVGQLLCYREWMAREYPKAKIGMNYVTYKKYSEIDYIATKFNIGTWLVVFANGEISHLEKYITHI